MSLQIESEILSARVSGCAVGLYSARAFNPPAQRRRQRGSACAPLTMGSRDAVNEFAAYQESRRGELWGLLGDLPWQHQPSPPRVVSTEKHNGYTLQRLVLDLNGVEPVPALLLIPDRRQHPAPGLLFMHWHAGMYDLGKEQLIEGVKVQPAYAPVCAEKGLVTLAIDSWCFGERKHESRRPRRRRRRIQADAVARAGAVGNDDVR